VVKGNTAVGVELEKQHASGGTHNPGRGSGGSGAGSDLIKPGD